MDGAVDGQWYGEKFCERICPYGPPSSRMISIGASRRMGYARIGAHPRVASGRQRWARMEKRNWSSSTAPIDRTLRSDWTLPSGGPRHTIQPDSAVLGQIPTIRRFQGRLDGYMYAF